MPSTEPPERQIETLRAYARERGAIMAISGHFCPPGFYWADIVQPGYGTVATGRTPLHAARAAISQFDHDRN